MPTFDDTGLTQVEQDIVEPQPLTIDEETPQPENTAQVEKTFDTNGLSEPLPSANRPNPNAELIKKYKEGFFDKEPFKKAAVEELIRRKYIDPMQYVDPALVIGSAAIAEPIAGWAGIAGTLMSGDEGQGADWVSKAREYFTKKPADKESAETLKSIGETVAPVVDKFTATQKLLGDAAFDLTGSATLAAAAATTPTALLELLGLRGLRALRRGEKLIDATGKPTEVLQIELKRQGLNYETLSNEAKALIPSEIEAGNLPGSKPIRKPVEQALVKQIESGSREDALAPFRAENGRLRADLAGVEAINQGFRPGFVQAIKTSNPATKAKMREMVDIMRKSKANERFSLDHRPSDIAGDAVVNRLSYIRNAANESRKELDVIAQTKLKGQPVDTKKVLSQLDDSLYDLDVDLIPDVDGMTKTKNLKGL